MRVIDKYNKTITKYDLTKGKLVKSKLKSGSEVEDVLVYVTEEQYKPKTISTKTQIRKLKSQLAASDYKVIKCSECNLIGESMPYDIVALHAERQAIRDEINRLEQEV